jgi:hypothetical protein
VRRSIIAAFGVVSMWGCADVLGIQDRYFDGGTTGDAAPSDGAPTDSANDAPNDAGTSCGPCTQNGANCEVIACHQDTPTAITTNGTRVVWANTSFGGGTSEVMAAPVAGGAATNVYPAGGNELPGLATLGTDSYVTTASGGNVVWLPGDGGSAQTIDSLPFAQAINVDPLDKLLVYSSFGNSGGVYTCPPNPPSACTGYEPVPNQANVQGVAIDQSNVYYATTTGGAGVYTCAWLVPCNSPTKLVASPSPTLVTVDGSYVYWVDDNFSSATIWRANKDGTNKLSIATAPASILGFVVDSGSVYYATASSSAGKIVRVKNDGTGSADLATGLRTGAGVAVDGAHVYFTEWGPFLDGSTSTDGRVMRVPR